MNTSDDDEDNAEEPVNVASNNNSILPGSGNVIRNPLVNYDYSVWAELRADSHTKLSFVIPLYQNIENSSKSNKLILVCYKPFVNIVEASVLLCVQDTNQ